MSTRCPATIFGSHKYEARYDEKPNEAFLDVVKRGGSVKNLLRNTLILHVYVQDVCLYCGDVIDRLEGKA